MTTAWDAFNPSAPPRRRIRGGEIPPPPPSGMTWRAQARAAREQQQYVAPEPEERNRAVWNILGFKIDMDAVFACALFVPMLFIANWGTMGAAMVAAMVPAYLFVRRHRLGAVLLKRILLFTLPGVALISVIWSEAPAESLKYAIEYFITVTAGVLICSGQNQEAVIRGLGVAFAGYVAVAIAVGGRIAVGVGAGGDAFSGLTGSKNLMADIASTGLIVSMAIAVMAFRSRSWLWIAFAVGAAGLELYSVIAARSAGALLGLGIGVAGYVCLLPLLAVGKVIRLWLTSVLALVLVVVGLNFTWLSQLLIETAANLFHKDSTLTGRTYLWYRASELIHEKPVLGRGYYAFWLQGNQDAEGLWRYFDISIRSGFTFHNTLIDILVTLGWVGASVIIATVIIAAVMLVRRFMQRPSLALCFWVAIFLYQIARVHIETIGIAPFYFSTVLAFAALGSAFGRVDSRKIAPARQPYRPPQPRLVQVWPVEELPTHWANGRWRPAPGSQRLRLAQSKGTR